MNIQYREPVKEDAEAMVKFYNRVGGETVFLSFEKDEYPLDAESQKENITSMNEHPACIVILAVDGGEIIGVGTITSGNKVKSRHCGELGIVISKNYHKAGIGTELMRRLIEFCRDNGVTTKIRLDVSSDNEVAVKLYQRFGFEIEGTLKNSTLINGEYFDTYVMGLML